MAKLLDKFGNPLPKAYGGPLVGDSRHRRQVPLWPADANKAIRPSDRRKIMSTARFLFAKVGMVRGAITDMARYSVGGGLVPQSRVKEREAGNAYEAAWRQWTTACDVTGRHSFGAMQRLASMRMDIDGDVGFLMVNGANGWPQLQIIEGHRIASEWRDDIFTDGVRLGRHGRPVSYKITNADKSRVVNADNFIHLYDPDRADQARGVSALCHAIEHCRDIWDILDYEKTGVKLNAAIGLAITTDGGTADPGASYIESGYDPSTATSAPFERFEAGMVPRLDSGEQIQSFGSNRPNPSFAGFVDFLIRDVSVGLGLPFEFVWNSEKLSGTAQRFILAKAARRFEERQQVLTDRFLARVWNWVIAKAIARGEAPATPGWWRVNWQHPAKITVDVGREATANRDDIRAGLRTIAEDAGERGVDWQELRDQSQREADDLLTRARALADAHDVSMEFATSLLQAKSANPPTNPEGSSAPQF